MALPAGRATSDDPNDYFAVAQQSGKDVDGTVFYFLKHLAGTGFDTMPEVSSERVGGSGREVGLRYRTKVTADGQWVTYAQPDIAGRVLACALPSADVVAGVAGASNAVQALFSHKQNSSGSQLPYFTAEQAWLDENERTGNCLYSSVKFEGEAGRPIKMTAQFISGGTPAFRSVDQVAVREGGFPIMMPGASVAIIANPYASAGQIGASSLQVTKWSLEIKNTLDGDIQTVALNREDVTWLAADYDVDGTLKYINRDFWNLVQYGGGSQVPVGLLENGQFFFSSRTPSQTGLDLSAPFVEFSSVKVNRLDPDGKTAYLDFAASTRQIGTQSLQTNVISTASQAYSLSTT